MGHMPKDWLVAAVTEELCGQPGQAVGVGLVAAAATMAARLAAETPSGVVLVGTAGGYPGGPPIGTVVTARTVALASGTAALGLGYVPMHPPALRAVALPDLRRAAVICCTAITSDANLALTLGKQGDVEHMEAYAVAWACARVGIPFAAVLGISNEVGPDAHAQWKANRAEAQAAAVLAARAWLEAGAPELRL